MKRGAYFRVLAVVLGVGLATPAGAELAAWDQTKVSELAKQLETSSKELYDTFYKQPVPGMVSGQRREYERLKQDVRRVRSEARELARALGKGEGRDETLPIYEHMMLMVRSARDGAQRVFLTQDVTERASAVRQTLNRLAPYYDPDAVPLPPPSR